MKLNQRLTHWHNCNQLKWYQLREGQTVQWETREGNERGRKWWNKRKDERRYRGLINKEMWGNGTSRGKKKRPAIFIRLSCMVVGQDKASEEAWEASRGLCLGLVCHQRFLLSGHLFRETEKLLEMAWISARVTRLVSSGDFMCVGTDTWYFTPFSRPS